MKYNADLRQISICSTVFFQKFLRHQILTLQNIYPHKNIYIYISILPVASYLQEVCSDAFVRALLGHLLGEPGDLVGRLGDVLGALDEGALVAAAAAHQARHLGHEQRHALRRRDDVVALHGTTRSLLLPPVTTAQGHCTSGYRHPAVREWKNRFLQGTGKSCANYVFLTFFLNAQGKKLTSKLEKKL